MTPSTGLPMYRARAGGPADATPESLLKHAEALQTQAAELAAIIAGAANQAGSTLMAGKGVGAIAKGIIRARNQRTRFFSRSLFSEPAWDILLELYVADIEQQKVAVSQLCATAGLAATTGLRWLSTLEANRLVIRFADPLDARRSFVALTGEGKRAMENFFESIRNMFLAA